MPFVGRQKSILARKIPTPIMPKGSILNNRAEPGVKKLMEQK